eukprot:4648506-Alexandrium_andersonii.AAC.1
MRLGSCEGQVATIAREGMGHRMGRLPDIGLARSGGHRTAEVEFPSPVPALPTCLLYTSDAADDM